MNKSIIIGTVLLCTFFASPMNAQPGPGNGPPPQPSNAELAACNNKASGASCSVTSERGTINGTCFAPQGRPLACRPDGGQGRPMGGGQGGSTQSNQGTVISSTQANTANILCSVRNDTLNKTISLKSNYVWSCNGEQRSLKANGIPEHVVGKFPNPGNPSKITTQNVSFSTSLKPVARTGSGVPVKTPGYAINGVKFDPGTGGTCQSGISKVESCSMGPGENQGTWRMEALGQKTFKFGEDSNNAHVQPSGEYHYHGIPEGMLSASARAGKTMALVGWASDGFPIYARFGPSDAKSAKSVLRKMRSSYQLKTSPDTGRPPTNLVPMGAFMQDYRYSAGSGDLDECNGRFAATPEFPKGIYHYYITETYPFIQRCVKGTPGQSNDQGQRPMPQR